MGLPMWRAPSPSNVKEPVKPDPTVSSRSPIRRRRSPGTANRRTASLRRSDGLWEVVTEPTHRRSARFDAVPGLLRDDTAPRSAHPDADAPDARAQNGSPPPLSSTASRIMRRGRRDSLALIGDSHWRRNWANDPYEQHEGMPPHPVRREEEPRLPSYTPNFAPARLAASTSDARAAEPLREWSSADFGIYGPRHASPQSYSGLPPLLPPPTSHRGAEYIPVEESPTDAERRAAPVGFPPLRRIGRRTIADGPLPSSSLRESWSPASTVDGLGDRERSFSPDPEWDTMLNSIQPDVTLPSASSSFASAAASRSFSNSQASSRSQSSNSASSSRTHLTVPSPSNRESELFDLCNEDTSGSDTEPEEATSAPPRQRRHRSSSTSFNTEDRSSLRDRVQYRVFVPDTFVVDERGRPSPVIRRRGRELRGFVNNYYRFAQRAERGGSREASSSASIRNSRESSARASLPAQDGPPAATDSQMQDPDLEEMRTFLERLARRDDIPDEFWMSAGLTRTMAQNVERAEEMLRARAERLQQSLERL